MLQGYFVFYDFFIWKNKTEKVSISFGLLKMIFAFATVFSVKFVHLNTSSKNKQFQLPVIFLKSCNELKNMVINKICDFALLIPF